VFFFIESFVVLWCVSLLLCFNSSEAVPNFPSFMRLDRHHFKKWKILFVNTIIDLIDIINLLLAP